MKVIIRLLLILLIGLTIACARVQIRPDVYCPDPVKPSIIISDDKSILEALNLIVDYSLARESQIECYKKAMGSP